MALDHGMFVWLQKKNTGFTRFSFRLFAQLPTYSPDYLLDCLPALSIRLMGLLFLCPSRELSDLEVISRSSQDLQVTDLWQFPRFLLYANKYQLNVRRLFSD